MLCYSYKLRIFSTHSLMNSHALCMIFMILVSLENVNKYSHVVARLPQKLKSMLFEIFSTLRVPFGHPSFEKNSNNIDFSLWGKHCISPTKMRPKLWKSHIVYLFLHYAWSSSHEKLSESIQRHTSKLLCFYTPYYLLTKDCRPSGSWSYVCM